MWHHFLDTSFRLMAFLLGIPKFRLLRIGHPSPTFESCIRVSVKSDPEVLTVVDKIKKTLISSPVLAYFDVNVVATDLYCDASGDSIGTVLQ